MFIEPFLRQQRAGWIEVICGCMFSGKTEELIRRLRRARIAHQQVEIFKPATDTRYHPTRIVSHDDHAIPSTPVTSCEQILLLSSDIDVVGIDEAQFFNDALPEVCSELALRGIRVIVAGLDMDYLGKPFGPVPHLMAMAEYVTKLHAICAACGNLAAFSFRKTSDTALVMLGEKDVYEPRCRSCFFEGLRSRKAQDPA
ncbi:MAG: thymidine kinase [Chitinophagales bacterium]|nr:thymidine kinase [Chitinophagales bacterium]MDW8427213.1 thymidine kinase [Chitinophagales bacterium]